VNEPHRTAPEPMRTNDTAVMLTGIGLWTIALIVLLLVDLPADRRWWIWTCVVGIGGGLFGIWYVRRFNRSPER